MTWARTNTGQRCRACDRPVCRWMDGKGEAHVGFLDGLSLFCSTVCAVTFAAAAALSGVVMTQPTRYRKKELNDPLTCAALTGLVEWRPPCPADTGQKS